AVLEAKSDCLLRLRGMPAELVAKAKAGGLIKVSPDEDALGALRQAATIEPAGSDVVERKLGDLYFELGRFGDAATTYARILKDNKTPENHDKIEVRYLEAVFREAPPSDMRRWNEALSQVDAKIAAEPKRTELLLLRTFAAMRAAEREAKLEDARQGIEAALGFAERAVAVDSRSGDAHYYHAMLKARLSDGGVQDAIAELEANVSPEPRALKFSLSLVDMYKHTRQLDLAADRAAAALKIQPQNAQIRSENVFYLMKLLRQERALPADCQLEIAQRLKKLNIGDRAYAQIREASELYRNDPIWPYLYGQYLLLEGKKQQAVDVLGALHKAVPAEAQLAQAWLEALNENGNFEACAAAAKGLLEGAPPEFKGRAEWVAIHRENIRALYKLGREEEALQVFDNMMAGGAASKRTDTVPALFQAVQKLEADLTLKTVVDCLRTRLQKKPEEDLTRLLLVQSLMRVGMKEALAEISGAREPADPALRLMFYRARSIVESQTGEDAGAFKDFQMIRDALPRDIETMNNFAFLLIDRAHEPLKGREMANRALQEALLDMLPGDQFDTWASLYDTVGYAKLQTGDIAGAVAALERSLLWAPQRDACLHLAMALEKQEKHAEALAICGEGLKLPKPPGSSEKELVALRDRLAAGTKK
ncbi:MAG TPA: hypothetical protein VHM90_19495, partial [Phycisphaerae bacterium]|nr:hypothetical protein [Phycisphaerae bacterium]